MAASFEWSQTTGASGDPTITDKEADTGNLVNFMSTDSATAADYSTNPITAGENSYEVFIRGKFGGTFNTIENLQFWRSTDFSPNTGLSVYWAGNDVSYSTPATTTSVATATVPTSDPGTANVTIGGSLSGSLTEGGYSDYICLQLRTTESAAAGDTSLATFTLEYDES